MTVVWLVRIRSVHPAGAVIVAVFGRTPIVARRMSPAAVVAGTGTASVRVPEGEPAEPAARKAI